MQRTCNQCSRPFAIDEHQLRFLDRMAVRIAGESIPVPPPTLCPDCRLQRRFAFRNQIHVLLARSPETGKSFFSMYPGAPPFPILNNHDWWDEKNWNPEDYRRDFDFQRPFFDQWRELRDAVPRAAVNATLGENSDYCNNTGHMKNCYLVFDAGDCEDCLYIESAYLCRDCIDCSEVGSCELCYDCAGCVRCYNLQSSETSTDCFDSIFLRNCRSCRNCFACANLVQAEYCIFNQPHSREEYQCFLKSIDLSSLRIRADWRQRSLEFFNTLPHPHLVGTRIENCTGNHLHSSKNVVESFFVTDGEDVRYGYNLSRGIKDAYDYSIWGEGAELIYEACVCGSSVFRLLFCFNCWNGSSDLLYCDSCMSCSHCFGSVSLKKRKYCILNRQYSKEEYEFLLPRILDHMRKTGEWGEFFPISCSPHPYNYTLANRYFPLSEHAARQRGYAWLTEQSTRPVDAPNTIELTDALPVSDDPIIAESVRSGKKFQITSEEIRRYRKFGVPLPRLTAEERMSERASRLGPLRLVERICERSGVRVHSAYDANWPCALWSKEEFDKSLV